MKDFNTEEELTEEKIREIIEDFKKTMEFLESLKENNGK